MASEETPLLSAEDNGPKTPDRLDDHDVYLRFSSTKKNIILVMVSGCGVINCMFIRSAGLAFHVLFMSRFSDWDVYTFNTTDCQGPEFNRGGCQVSAFLKTFVSKRGSSYFLFPVSLSACRYSLHHLELLLLHPIQPFVSLWSS
jgi:hypothetical protein